MRRSNLLGLVLAGTMLATPVMAFDVGETAASVEAEKSTSFHGGHWAKFDPNQPFMVDHKPMSTLLGFISVEEKGKRTTRYQAVKARAYTFVQAYKNYLQGVKVSLLNRDEQLAYWLNVHNVLVVEKISQNFSKKSGLKKLRGTPGKPGQWWSEKSFTVEGYALSLEDIEQRILIDEFRDPRILYALSYGVKGAHLLHQEAFTGDNVHARLDALASEFLNDRANVRKSGKGLRLNNLLVWNQDALFTDNQALLNHIGQFAKGRLKKDIASLSAENLSVTGRFSWRSDAFVARRSAAGGFGGTGAGGGGGGGGGFGS